MRAERNATAAMDTHERLTCGIEIDGIHRTGLIAGTAANAKAFFHDHTATFALGIGSSGADRNTGRRIAGKTGFGFEAGGQSTRRQDTYAGGVPGQALVHQTGTRQRTGMATDTALHSRGGQYLQWESPDRTEMNRFKKIGMP